MLFTHVRNIKTPWSPYAVTFSRDGSLLAIGGGRWYGEGGLMLVGVDDGRAGVLSWADARWANPDQLRSRPPRPASVSGLCFSDDDRFLAASLWASSQLHAPTMLLDVDGTRLSLRQLFNNRGIVPYSFEMFPLVMYKVTATGVLLHDDYVITRRHRTSERVRDVLVLDRLPSDLGVRATNHTQHLTHSRLVVVRDTVITEAGGHYGHVMTTTVEGPLPLPKGLAMRELSVPDPPARVMPVDNYPRITAIAALPGNDGFVIGGNQGQIDEWSWEGGWRQQQLRAADAPNRWPVGGEDGLEFPGIQAIVSLAGSHTLVAVSAEGQLLVRAANGEWASEQLPEPGKPRSLAAHPTRPWVAVGIKQWKSPTSVVAILAVDP